MYHLIVAKDSMVWEIRHPLILNEWFNAAVTWRANVGLKFYVNGDLVASDSSPSQLNALNDGPFFTVIESEKYGGHWGKSVSIDDVSVWSMSLDKETIERNSEGIHTCCYLQKVVAIISNYPSSSNGLCSASIAHEGGIRDFKGKQLSQNLHRNSIKRFLLTWPSAIQI